MAKGMVRPLGSLFFREPTFIQFEAFCAMTIAQIPVYPLVPFWWGRRPLTPYRCFEDFR